MANRRIYYAVQQVGIAPNGGTSYTEIHGLQSVGITTTFDLEQVFELGQVEIYENIEEIPDIEVTMEKVLDGYPLMYHLCTQQPNVAFNDLTSTLAGRQNEQSSIALAIFDDTKDSSTGTPQGEVAMSGMFVQNVSYTIPSDGNMTESITLVGNDKVWVEDASFNFTGAFNNTDTPLAISASGGVQRRENLLFHYDGFFTGTMAAFNITSGKDINGASVTPSGTILPTEIDGITSSGTNELTGPGGSFAAHIQGITVSVDLGREEIFELGRKGPYFRFATFPTEVTCEIEVLTPSGDLISATEAGVLAGANPQCEAGTNLSNQTIKIAVCEGTRINLGTNNKLASVSQTGGDAGGGNVTSTFSYSTFNSMTVSHFNDPNASLDQDISQNFYQTNASGVVITD